MNNKNILFRAMCLILSFTFMWDQIAFAADTFSYKYKYSASKSLLPDNSQKSQNYIAPAYLVYAQARHEAVISQKNLVETQSNYTIQSQQPVQSESLVLQKKRSSSAAVSGKQVAYTLTDYDPSGKPQQIYVYTYTSGGALSKIASYDIRDFAEASWANSSLEKVSEDGESLVMASYTAGDYTQLSDSLKVKTIVYSGSSGSAKIEYILSDYVDGTPESVSIYEYGSSSALAEVNTYDITAVTIDFEASGSNAWKGDLSTGGSLVSKAIYEGSSGEEKEAYALSDYADGVAGRIDCYDYNSDDAISQTRAYNIKGLTLSDSLTDLRANSESCDQYLISKTNYTGAKGHEVVDSVLTSYYLDTSTNSYKAAYQTSYIYNTDGHLEKTATYYIKEGAYVLSQCAEYTGLKDYEVITLSYDYAPDGATIASVSVYNYDLAVDADNSAIGGDGNKRTLDKITAYVGTSDPYDLTGAVVEGVTFYKGSEGKELKTHTFTFDITAGAITVRTDYKYVNNALTETDTYRLLDSNIGYDTAKGVLVSNTLYIGNKGYEKASGGTSYDLSGNILTTTAYQYNANGSLGTVMTFDPNGVKISLSVYSGSEGQEKITNVTSFDLSGDILTISYYSYGIANNLETTVIYNTDCIKTSETTYDGRSGCEKAISITAYDLAGAILTTTFYNYNIAGTITSTVIYDSFGAVSSETYYAGPAGYEKISYAVSFDKSQNVLTIISYLYDVSGALTSTMTADPDGIITAISFYSGLSGYEKIASAINFDKIGNVISVTNYSYNAAGALESTVTIDADGVITSETSYSGRKEDEKVASVTTYDKTGNILALTKYDYASSGALYSTVTYDANGIITSESVYSGLSSREKVSTVTTLDKLGTILTVTSYFYGVSGVLTEAVTCDSSGIVSSETDYSGLESQEKISLTTTYDKTGNILTITSYSYDASGALLSTVTKDSGGVIVSESVYSGLSGCEKVLSVITFDHIGGILTTTGYSYDASGALDSTITRDADGIKTSETTYSGLSDYEKTSTVTSYDKSGNILAVTNYIYTASGALANTVTCDADSIVTSESAYSGLLGEEKVSVVTSYDKSGTILTKTNYVYAFSGALTSTVTCDSSGVITSEASYSGLENREKISQVTTFDKSGNILTATAYSYASSGALINTITADADGIKLSETVYSGLSGYEKVSAVTTLDKLGAILTTTSYSYASSGALINTITVDADGIKLSETVYSGLSGAEKIISSATFDKNGNVLTATAYSYAASGALAGTVTTDSDGIIISESTYFGLSSEEKISTATTYDKSGSILAITTYSYASSGAIESTITKNSDGIVTSVTIYSGLSGYENVSTITTFDSLGVILTATSYSYGSSGALCSTVTCDSNDVITSQVVYSGPSGAEKISTIATFDKSGVALAITNYTYNASGALTKTAATDGSGVVTSESVYSGLSGEEKVVSVTIFDKLHDTLTITTYSYDASGAIAKTVTSDVADTILSETIYLGLSGYEKISYVAVYDDNHNILTITNYSYDASGALTKNITKDSSGVVTSETVYSGLSGEEKVSTVKAYDKSGNILTIATYSYDISGALISTATNNSDGIIISESVYSGLSGYEKISSVISYDKSHNVLTTTSYTYNVAGAFTLATATDSTGVVISATSYSGLENQENIASVTTFDKTGNVLATTSYSYNSFGALIKTVTEDSGGVITSETVYSGLSGEEKASTVTAFDATGNILTITNYAYDASGALTLTVTTDSGGVTTSESVYSGLSGEEKIVSSTTFDNLGSILTTTAYSYAASGALASIVACDSDGVITSRSLYAGLSGEEKVSSIITYDASDNVLTTTIYSYDDAGALSKTITSDSTGMIKCESAYSGLSGYEKISTVTTFDNSGTVVTATSYIYDASGELASTATVDSDGVVTSESVYSGLSGFEKITSTISFDKSHDIVSVTAYTYDASGALIATITKDADDIITSSSVYTGREGGEKVSGVTTFDKLENALSTTSYSYDAYGALAGTVTTDPDGIIISESTYSGLSGEEKITSSTTFDKLHNALTVTNYSYTASGALAGTVTRDSQGIITSETLYTGLTGEEKISSVTTFDKLYNVLTQTDYTYDLSGALILTVTTDPDGIITSESTYSGPTGYEKALSATSYDKSGDMLSMTNYSYNASGALTKTVTKNSSGVITSESVYSGLSGYEKASAVTTFDDAGNALTVTTYSYDGSGALVLTVTVDSEDVVASVSAYSGLSGEEKIASSTTLDKLGDILTATIYSYDVSGALTKTVMSNSSGIVTSESAYSGLSGCEKLTSVATFDENYNIVGVTTYTYATSGAITGTITKDSLGFVTSVGEYSGLSGSEKIIFTTSYSVDPDGSPYLDTITSYTYDGVTGSLLLTIATDSDGNITSETIYKGLSGEEKADTCTNYYNGAVDSITNYVYSLSGALAETITYDSLGATKLSETYFAGLAGFEISDYTVNYYDDGAVKSTVYYYYGPDNLRAPDAFVQDALTAAKTHDQTGELVNIAYYEGLKGAEVMFFSQAHTTASDSSVAQIESTVIYEYGAGWTLAKSYTYFDGAEGSSDVTGLTQNCMAEYSGARGHEEICYMEGTTCQYAGEDTAEWDYYARTDFTYDSEGRNTGYIEAIYTPGGEWAWDASSGTLSRTTEVAFSDFDSDGRYNRMVRSVVVWNDATLAYDRTGEVTTQENYIYDSDEHLASYNVITVVPNEDTTYKEVTLDDYSGDNACAITTWELDENLVRTGDYSKQSGIVYDSRGRMKSYTLTTSDDSAISISTVYDIVYDKDKIIEDKVASGDDTIFFGENYSLRTYKYNTKGEVETTVVTNGDYTAIYDTDNRLIYFEYSESYQALIGSGSLSGGEDEAAGSRSGSASAADYFNDIISVLEASEAYQDINLSGATSIEYNAEGEVAKITDAKGNVFIYSDNRFSELQDGSGNTIAAIAYTDSSDGALSVSVSNLSDGSSAEFTYDADCRRVLVEETDSTGVATRLETYSYTYTSDGNVLTVSVHKEYYEDSIAVVVDSVEGYDENEKPVSIVTYYHKADERSYVSKWTCSYDSDGHAVYSTDIRCEAASYSLFDGTAALSQNISAYIDIFSAGGYSSLSSDDMNIFGAAEAVIYSTTWAATYDEEGRVATTETSEDDYQYEQVTDVCSSTILTVNSYVSSLSTSASNACDGDLDTYSGYYYRERGGSGYYYNGNYTYWTWTFTTPQDIVSLSWLLYCFAQTWSGASNNSGAWGVYITITSDSGTTVLADEFGSGGGDWSGGYSQNNTVVTDSAGWTGVTQIQVRLYGQAKRVDDGAGGGNEDIYHYMYEMQAVSDDYTAVNLVHKTSQTSDYVYDEKNNILQYTKVDSECAWSGYWGDTGEGTVTTTTTWTATGYTANKVTGYTEVAHTVSSDGTLDFTVTTTRSNMVYEGGILTGYEDVSVSSSAPDEITDSVFSNVAYDDYGRIIGYTEITRTYGTDSSTSAAIDVTTATVRYDMTYDAKGNLTGWTEDITVPTTRTDVTSITTHKVTTDGTYDASGRIKTFTETDTGLVDISSGSALEWREITTQRTATYYNTDSLILYEKDIVTTKDSSGNTLSAKTTITNGIQYDSNGRQCSYTTTIDGAISHVDSSRYNGLGQLVENYTAIENGYSENLYTYDSIGNLLTSQNHYYYDYSYSESQGKDSTITVHQHSETWTDYDKYGAQTSQTKNEYVNMDVESGFWDSFGSWFQSIVDVFLQAINVIPGFQGVGSILATVFDAIMSMANGTFSWVNFGVSIGLDILQMNHFFDNLFAAAKKLLPESVQGIFSNLINAGKSATTAENYWNAVCKGLIQTAVSKSIVIAGDACGWNTFLTSAVSSFASMAIGYGYDNAIGKINLAAGSDVYMTLAAIESVSIAAIDYYVEQNPSELNSALSAVTKNVIGGYFDYLKTPSLHQTYNSDKCLDSYKYQETSEERFYNDAKEASVLRAFDYNIYEPAKDFYLDSYDLRTFDIRSTSDFYQLATERNSILQDTYAQAYSVSKAASEYTSADFLEEAASSVRAGDFYKNATASGFIYMSEIDASFLTGKALEVAQALDITSVTLLYNSIDGEFYVVFDISQDIATKIEGVLNILASDQARASYNANFSLKEGDYARIVMTEDGQKAYLQGEVGFDSLKGTAKDWAAMSGLKSGDRINIEMDLKTGEVYLFLDVKDAEKLLSHSDGRKDVSKLKDAITKNIAISDVKSLHIDVRISPDSSSEIVGATFEVEGTTAIKNEDLKKSVTAYLNTNFAFLKDGQYSIIFAIDISSSKVDIEAIKISTDTADIKAIIKELSKGDLRQYKLSQAIDGLVKIAGSNLKDFKILLAIDGKGNYVINVTVLASVFMDSPGLLAKLGINEASVIARSGEAATKQSLFSTTTSIGFTIDVATGAYSLDLGLKCQKYQSISISIGEIDITKDLKGRVIEEDIYDKTGELITIRSYAYSEGSLLSITETYFAELSDGSFKSFNLVKTYPGHEADTVPANDIRTDGKAMAALSEQILRLSDPGYSLQPSDIPEEFWALSVPGVGPAGTAVSVRDAVGSFIALSQALSSIRPDLAGYVSTAIISDSLKGLLVNYLSMKFYIAKGLNYMAESFKTKLVDYIKTSNLASAITMELTAGGDAPVRKAASSLEGFLSTVFGKALSSVIIPGLSPSASVMDAAIDTSYNLYIANRVESVSDSLLGFAGYSSLHDWAAGDYDTGLDNDYLGTDWVFPGVTALSIAENDEFGLNNKFLLIGLAVVMPAAGEKLMASPLSKLLGKADGAVLSDGGKLFTKLANPLPEDGLFARAMSANNAEKLLGGTVKFARENTRNEAFIGAYKDVANAITPEEIATRFSLFRDFEATELRTNVDTVIVFRGAEDLGLSTPINAAERGFGNLGTGKTLSGAREWAIENLSIQDFELKGLSIEHIYSVNNKGEKFIWDLVAKEDGTYTVLTKEIENQGIESLLKKTSYSSSSTLLPGLATITYIGAESADNTGTTSLAREEKEISVTTKKQLSTNSNLNSQTLSSSDSLKSYTLVSSCFTGITPDMAGATFKYLLGDKFVTLDIGRDLKITGAIPVASLGLTFDLPGSDNLTGSDNLLSPDNLLSSD
ncbi:MAG: hypothetical protein PHS46_06930, partial [Candidatus Omnitrophica bacterium]|nr:hypothetical protein [Candidatus Omnitrophota bacterium]